ncbi:MAG: matrixin family metalloprotease [Polyangiales bacterium]
MNSAARGLLCMATAAFALLPSRPASAYCRMTTESGLQIGNTGCTGTGKPLFWKNPCLSYAIDSRGSQWMSFVEVEQAVDLAFQAWEDADCGGSPPNLIFHRVGPSTCSRPEYNNKGNVNTIAFLDPWEKPCAAPDEPDLDPFALAVTIVWRDGNSGEILDADMMINDQMTTRFNAGGPYANCPDTGCPPGSSGAPGPSDLRSIVTHEAGHFIGIGHSDIPEATMYYQTDQTSVSKRYLAQDDIDAVCDIYPPGDLDSSCDATPIGGLLLNCETDPSGNPIACDDPAAAPSSGGCSASATSKPADFFGIALMASMFGLMALRRRSRRRDARS